MVALLHQGQVPKEYRLGIDIGTKTVKVVGSEIADPAKPDNYVDSPLEFPTNNRTKTTTELDTTIVFSEDGSECAYGCRGLSLVNAHIFRDWKPGAMGLQPHAKLLANACKLLEQSARQLKPFTPGTLFRKLFLHVLKTAQDFLTKKYGDASEGINITCVLTYPVSCSESLQILLLQEADAAGLDVLGALSESLAAGYTFERQYGPTLPYGASLILDYGGATLVFPPPYPPGRPFFQITV
ncbi:hypothetical protein N7523_005835 [Penicillium sp. IBT 18751x]|nr:hypothetical protein N7523_005835 [Penicillium sp. IBT 18751x]